MNIIKPFFLGGVGGLVLALILLIGLYASPLRESLYFRADPEISVLREKLARHQEWMSAADLRIAEEGLEAEAPDSLRTAQGKAWREYKQTRNRLTELARVHADGKAAGFWDWTYSLRYWAVPGALGLALFPGLLFSVLILFGSRGKRRRQQEKRVAARSQALESFEAAVKKFAALSGVAEIPDVAVTSGVAVSSGVPVSSDVPVNSDKIILSDNTMSMAAPEAQAPEPTLREDGRETRFMDLGTGWADVSLRSGMEAQGLGTPELSMQDEDAQEEDEPPPGSVLPPTTELERVERRKAEVLKLARKGMTSSEISRRLRISQDQVEIIIRLRRDRGE